MGTTPIAIVGLGGVFPGAPDLGTFGCNLFAKVDAARRVPPERWILDPDDAYAPGLAPDKAYSDRACFIDDFPFDPGGLNIDAEFLGELDPLYTLALHVGRQAYQDGVTATIDPQRVGVMLAAIALPTDSSSAITRETVGRVFAQKLLGQRADELFDTASKISPLNAHVAALPAGLLAAALGLGGGSLTLDAACASSLYAIKLACDELRAGRADAMLAGGVSRPESLYTQMGFSQLQALSPSGVCRPFDAGADGLVVGEGAGMVLLKRLDDARRDGDHIYAIIRGIGLSNDIAGSLLASDSEGQLRAMRAAYEEAEWSPTDVDLIECHGTGTPVGDAAELQSLHTLWHDRSWCVGQCAIGSVKSMIGHLLTAAGAAGLAKVLLGLQAKRLPPTANFAHPAPGFQPDQSPFRVQTEAAPWPRRREQTPRRAAVSAFGFGGINAHLLLEEWDPTLHAQSGRTAPAATPRPDSRTPIAIVGMALRVGNTDTLAAFRELVLNGESAIRPRPAERWRGCDELAARHFDGRDLPGAYIDSLSIDVGEFRLPPTEIPEILPQQLLMLQVVARALDDAGLRSREPRPRNGVIIGAGLDLNTSNYHHRWLLLSQARRWARDLGLDLDEQELADWIAALRDQAGPTLNANRVMGSLGNIVASRIAREFGFGGPSFAISAEEASGLRALEVGVRALQQNELDTVVVGAVDLPGDVRSVLTTHALRSFSTCGEARPFDAAADGAVVGEGAIALVLKRLPDARADGDRVYAVVRGLGFAGGDQPGEPTEHTYVRALERAYADAAVASESVDYIEAHGSGVPDEDRTEMQALATFFCADNGMPRAIGAVKANIGHLGAAAGLASVAKAALCLCERVISPVRGFERLPSAIGGSPSALILPRQQQRWSREEARGPRRAGVSAIALDGNCAHVVLEEPDVAVAARISTTETRGQRSQEPRRAGRSQITVPTGAPPPEPKLPERAVQRSQIPRFARDDSAEPRPTGSAEAGSAGRRQIASVSGHQRVDLPATVAHTSAATTRAHEAFLSFSQTATRGLEQALSLQAHLIETLGAKGRVAIPRRPDEQRQHETVAASRGTAQPPVAYPREMCLEFATGSVANALGPEFAEVDAYPARVRLPDEPLMLVDRIVSLTGEKNSLTAGTIVTEHDVLPHAWYLDGGRAPVCITLEAGQADLFLCSYLGIDLRLKGQRTYRLLDATVRFHRGLPRPGETVRYEITIDRFLRQGETYLFFFRFVGTIDGRPVITMTDGCAGFFTEDEIENSGGIVLTSEGQAPHPGRRPADWRDLVPMATESYSGAQLDALRAGDLAGCFGPAFTSLNLRDPLRIPSGRLRLVHRVIELNPTGGRYGLGLIRAEADIHPDDWFLTCHFVDDMVMPGTLMYECCHQTLRIFLLRMGWVGEQGETLFEPYPDVPGKLRCRGPVTPETKVVTYEVQLKEIGHRPEPYVRADALMYADGKGIVQFTDMSLKLSGATRQRIEEMWRAARPAPVPTT